MAVKEQLQICMNVWRSIALKKLVAVNAACNLVSWFFDLSLRNTSLFSRLIDSQFLNFIAIDIPGVNMSINQFSIWRCATFLTGFTIFSCCLYLSLGLLYGDVFTFFVLWVVVLFCPSVLWPGAFSFFSIINLENGLFDVLCAQWRLCYVTTTVCITLAS